MSILKSWDKFDKKMKDRAIEELLRFMTLFSTSAALICFAGTFLQNGDMTLSLVLLTFMIVISSCWMIKKRNNEKRWGVAKRTGAEIFRIGMTQPTEEERLGIKQEKGKKAKKKNGQNTTKRNPKK